MFNFITHLRSLPPSRADRQEDPLHWHTEAWILQRVFFNYKRRDLYVLIGKLNYFPKVRNDS